MKRDDIFLIAIFGMFFIFMLIYIFVDQDKGESERTPAVYYVKKVDVGFEFDKYNIYKGQQLVAIVNLQLEDFDMIYSDLINHKSLQMEGSINDVSAECVLIMGEIYKRNKEVYGKDVALGILTNMLIKAIYSDAECNQVEWGITEAEKLAYTE